MTITPQYDGKNKKLLHNNNNNNEKNNNNSEVVDYGSLSSSIYYAQEEEPSYQNNNNNSNITTITTNNCADCDAKLHDPMMTASTPGNATTTTTTTTTTTATPKISVFRIFCLTLVQAGVNFCFSSEFIFVTPILLSYNVSHFWTSFFWAAGPLSGLFTQTIGGFISDRCTSRFGRRRPFIVVGAIMTIVGAVLFINASLISTYFHEKAYAAVLAIFFIALWLENIGLNLIQGPGYALVLDLCNHEQQVLGSAILSFTASMANTMTGALGFVNLVKYMPFLKSNGAAMYYISCIVLLFTCIVTVLAARGEKPFKPQERQQQQQTSTTTITINNNSNNNSNKCLGAFFMPVWRSLRRITLPIVLMLVVYMFSTAAFTPFQFFNTDYFGTNVYHGDPNAPDASAKKQAYERGVQAGSLGFALCSLVSMLYSAVVERMTRRIGVKPVYFIAHLVATACLLLPLWPAVQTVYPSLTLNAFLGIFNATIGSVPFGVIGMSISKEDVGIYIGILNSIQVLAQLVMNFSASSAISLFHDNVVVGIAIGGGFAAMGCFALWLLRIPKPQPANATTATTNTKEQEESGAGVHPTTTTTTKREDNNIYHASGQEQSINNNYDDGDEAAASEVATQPLLHHQYNE